jgi:EmrB/QacA subfamily drug resistance transporter
VSAPERSLAGTADSKVNGPVATAPGGPWGETLDRRRIVLVLVSVMLGMLMGALDATVVGTAMPRVIADLNGLQHYAWVTTGYLLASAASMPIWGKLSDSLGRRRFFVIGMVIFVIGSALCGQSRSMIELVGFRAVQGLGAGAMMPITAAIIGDIFPPATRAKWQGMLFSVHGFATIVGPLLGGWITDTIGWRWTFYVNLPVGAISIVFALTALPGHVRLRKHPIDFLGTALLVVASMALLLGFSWAGSEYAWSSPIIIGLLVFSVAMWFMFYLCEMRVAEPVVNPRLFKNSIFSISVAAGFFQTAVLFGLVTFLPLFVQGVMGRTATSSGTVLMPMMLTHVAVSIGSGWLLSHWGRYRAMVISGFVLVTAGAFLLSRMSTDTTSAALVGFMMLTGFGNGLSMGPFNVIVQNQYPRHRLGEVSAAVQFFRSMGGTVGLAILGSMLNRWFASSLMTNLPEQLKGLATDPATADQIANPQVLLSQQAQTQLGELFSRFGDQASSLLNSFTDVVRQSLESSLVHVFLVVMAFEAAGLLLVLFLREVRLRRSHAEVLGENE